VSEDITVLISKKGKATIKRKRKTVQAKAADLSHNRKKKYILTIQPSQKNHFQKKNLGGIGKKPTIKM